MEHDLVLIDWLSITTKDLDEVGLQKLIDMEDVPWELIKGMHGYKDRLYFSGISIHYNGRDDMGVWLEMSGQGCRTFESLGSGDYEKLFRFVLSGHGNITRLDVAYDDHSGILPIETICADSMRKEFVSRFRYVKVEWSDDGKAEGRCVYHGSEKSEIRFRIYDKAAERHCEAGTHWVRVESQLRRDRALKFIGLPGTIGEKFAGVLANYLLYVEPSETDSNKWRWSIKDYWAQLLNGAADISLYVKPGMEYNIDHLDRYVFKQAGNAIDAAIQLYGFDGFVHKLKERHTLPNPKYRQLVETYKGKI